MKKILFACLLLAATTLNAQQAPKEKPTCTATTVKGLPCKSTILMKDAKCRAHSDLTPRCGAEKSSGGKCRMAVKSEGEKCQHHKDS